jgi:hypothetical protein
LRENADSTLCAELIQEFMEFYRLKYSLAIFGPETNIKGKTEDRNVLAKKIGINAQTDKPLLMSLLDSFSSKPKTNSVPSLNIPSEPE